MDEAQSLARRASDRLLAERAADGDVDAFTALVRRHGGIVRAYAVKVLGSPDAADDVVQDTFVRAWERLDELRDPSAVRAWLMRIASNRAIELLRARKPEAELPEHDAPATARPGPADAVEAGMVADDLSQALRRLPARQRECWLLAQFGGLSYAEIAAQLGIPATTVRGQLARARRTLIGEMEAWR